MTWMIVGLGNPGPQYAGNRHNIGFMVIDRLAQRWGSGGFRDKFHAQWGKTNAAGQEVVLLKPMTYMNRSGTSVGEAGSFFKVPLAQCIVIHDELDLAYEGVQVKVGGGHAGHNGLRSIFEHYGRDFVRVRCGIGRPKFGDVADFVLNNFSTDERAGLDAFVDKAVAAIELILEKGALAAQNETNRKEKPPKPPKAPKPPREPKVVVAKDGDVSQEASNVTPPPLPGESNKPGA